MISSVINVIILGDSVPSGGGGGGPTTGILAENSDFLITESNDYLVQE